MSVTDRNIVDGIAHQCDGKTLIMEIYDHLDFEGKFEYDHIIILQDKINSYLQFINSKQYEDIYPDKKFSKYLINIHFLHQLTNNCKKYIDVSNQKLLESNIEIVPQIS